MKGGFVARIKFDSIRDAEIVYKALSVELLNEEAKLYLDRDTLTLMLRGESLRAGVNSWLRLIKVCIDVLR